MSAPGLDFLLIGSPKAGTTSLHEYMRTHPELFLPEAKEQQFFTRDEAYEAGWEAFAAVAFHGAPPGRLLGKATPQYLGGPAMWSDEHRAAPGPPVGEATADRIARMFPRLKLIAILRDPVERAISSYWQAVVLRDEERPIDVAFEEELAPASLQASRRYPLIHTQYLAVGEYGRLLSAYLDRFPREQLFVGSLSALAEDPQALLRDLWRYLGVEPSHVPPNLGTRYQTRGTGGRSRIFTAAPRIKELPGISRLWASLPGGLRDSLRARSRTAGHRAAQRSRQSGEHLQGRPSPELVERLREFYAPDLELLRRLVGPVDGVT